MVSVILPAYNGERFIRETIDSVLIQTYNDIELIVVDDGSTDKTAEIANSIAHPKIRYYYQNNSGVASARNKGIEISKGEYIASIDQDDLWLPDKLEKQLKLFNNPEVGVVYSKSIQIGINGEKLEQRKKYKLFRGSIFRQLLANNFITSASVVIKSATLQDNKLKFRGSCQGADDWDLWLRLSRVTQFEYVDEPLVKIRIHDENYSHKGDSMYQSSLNIINDIRSEILKDVHIGKNEKVIQTKLLNKGYFLQTLYFGHWLLSRRRKDEARSVFLGLIKKDPLNIRPFWGIFKSYMGKV